MNENKWIFCPKEQPDAQLRLFCFPYAGSGASLFYEWPNKFSPEIEICAIKLPGRESRFKEKPYRRMTTLVEKLASEMLPFLNKPFLFFGHSLGAHISFKLARYLRRNKLPCPMHMFVSGARAPHIPETDTDPLHYEMDDEKFINKIFKLGGLPEDLFKNHMLLDLFLPILKADIEMLNTDEYTEEDPLDCDISSFGGAFDLRVTREDCEAWSKHTGRDFSLTMFSGGHFFINTHHDQLIKVIIQDIRRNLEYNLLIGNIFKSIKIA
jgi:medium-chain acyl-[acyl-carrier-protein] hydrolase